MNYTNTVTNDESIKFLGKLGNKISAKQVKLINTLISRVPIQHQISFDPHLTGSEINCLLLAAKGKTSSETASLLGVKPSTVESHRQKIMRKLSCHTIAQAVFEGILFGYLPPKFTTH